MTNERHEKALEAADWIEHDGEGMPVDRCTIVSVKLRGGDETPDRWRTPAHSWNWKWEDDRSTHGMRSGDIIAYRIVSTNHFTNGE